MVTDYGLNRIATEFNNMISSLLINDEFTTTIFEQRIVEDNVFQITISVPNAVALLTNIKVISTDNEILAEIIPSPPLQIEIDTDFRVMYTFRNAQGGLSATGGVFI